MEGIREIDENSSEREKLLRELEGLALRGITRVNSIVEAQKTKNKTKGFKKRKRTFISENYSLEKLREHVWPLAERLSDSDESFKEIAEVAHGTYGDILLRQTQRAEDFCENNFHIEYFKPGADFEYYYHKYGKENAYGIALYAAQFLQPKKKGDFDVKPKTRAEIEELWAFVENLSLKQKNLIGQICQTHYSEGIETFLKIIPEAISYFNEKGKPEYLDYYLEISSKHTRFNTKHESIFPILDLPAVFEEFEALSAMGDLKESGFDFAKNFMNSFGESMTFKKNIEECAEKDRFILWLDKERVEHYFSKLSIPDFIEKIRASGCDDARIKELLDLPSKYPKIDRTLVQLLMCLAVSMHEYESDFDQFVNFVEETKSYILYDQNFFVDFIGSSRSIPNENIEKFWALAKRVVKYLRDDSIAYASFFCYSEKLKDLYKNDFDAYEKVIEEMMNFTYQFSATINMDTEINRLIVKDYLLFFGDPKFEEFLSGLKILLARAQDENHHERFGKDHEVYLKRLKYIFPHYLVETTQKDEKGELLNALNQNVDCLALANGIAAVGFDLNQVEYKGDYKIDGLGGTDILKKYFFSQENSDNSEKISRVFSLSNEVSSGCDDGEDLKAAIAEMSELLGGAPSSSLENLVKRVKKDALEVLDIQDWRRIMGFSGGQYAQEAIIGDHWIYKANSSTQLAASSGALFFGLGLSQFSGDLNEISIPEGILEKLPLDDEFAAFARGEIKMREVLEAVRKKNLEGKLRENIKRALPFISSAIHAERIKYPGLMSVGTKIESMNSLKNEDFRFILELAGFGDIRNTPFNLKHAGRSLVNPPLPSALEEKLLIYLFMMFGTVDPDKIDMQVTIGGRLNNENAGVVCASSILTSDVSVQYAESAFETEGHFIGTDRRIMVYDAGVRKKSLPYDIEANGRTDKVGCRSLVDIKLLQILGTFAVHKQFEGSFAEQFEVYKNDFERILKAHGLHNKFKDSAWVSAEYNPYDPPEYHDKMIRNFTEARRDNEMLVAETRVLMARRLQAYLRDNRDRIIAENPAEFERLKAY